MNDIRIFNNDEFGRVRTVIINNNPMFCLSDVCKILEIKNVSDCKSRLKLDGVGSAEVIDSLGRKQSATFINESNLYKIIFQSRKESAERFTDWVTSEILPSIRKNGIYATDNVIDNILNNPDFGIELLTKLKEERAARVKAEQTNAILMHVNKTYTATEIAKELGLRSAIQLNKILEELRIQFKVNDTWVMCSDYSHLGYEEIKQEVLDSGKVIYHRRITQLGREFIINKVREFQNAA